MISALVALSSMATEAAGEGHSETNPYIYGGVALGTLLLLLWITTRINVDR